MFSARYSLPTHAKNATCLHIIAPFYILLLRTEVLATREDGG
jgi:hypothetical protein